MSDFLTLDVEGFDAPDEEFEAARHSAEEKVSDAENGLLAAQMETGHKNSARIRAARNKVRAAITALQELEEEWQNEHAFDLIAY